MADRDVLSGRPGPTDGLLAQFCEASGEEGLKRRKRVREGLAPQLPGAGDSLIDFCR